MTPPRPAGAQGPQRSVVLESSVRLVFHAILATSLFFLVSGHNSPGGGFIGGLVAGSAFVLRYLAGGQQREGSLRFRPEKVLGLGLLVASLAAVVPWFSGGQVLESGYTYLTIPVLGRLPLTSVLVFDTGVFLIVVGIVLTVLSTLGSQATSALGRIEQSEQAGTEQSEQAGTEQSEQAEGQVRP
ncbi:MnhB domain-containing protein [Quadrisphaera sp. GCM10027208]|uniref:MnhB domain-containing protein n=1 Tax=Quadrisphaera sp. GCM10027208 TaxID=3273423 RepID=UPI003606E434|nr:cation transporter [Kineosporiaceae bacterium SCSIO 59966]